MNAAADTGQARQRAMARLLSDIHADVAAYGQLLELLEQQFDAALRHRHADLAELAAGITDVVDQMQARRQMRVALVAGLAGAQARMAHAFALLKEPARDETERLWAALQQTVLECQRRNERNRVLMTDQYSIMQRVLQGEEQLYAPA